MLVSQKHGLGFRVYRVKVGMSFHPKMRRDGEALRPETSFIGSLREGGQVGRVLGLLREL